MVRANVNMSSTYTGVVPIDVDMEHRKKVISTIASEVIKALAVFVACDLIV